MIRYPFTRAFWWAVAVCAFVFVCITSPFIDWEKQA